MNTFVSAERGTMLLEALISATLLMVTVVTVISFMHRALKGVQIQNRLLAPSCEHQRCARSGDTSTCTCRTHRSVVLH